MFPGALPLRVIGNLAFAMFVAVTSYDRISREFQKAWTSNVAKGFGRTLLSPCGLRCRPLLLRHGLSKNEGRCWYEIPKFRKMFPEYRELNDEELSDRLYEKAGIEITPARPWTLVVAAAAIAIGVPVAVLIVSTAFN